MKITGTVQEAMDASGLGRSTLYAKMADRELQTVTVGRRRLVVWSSLMAMLDPAKAA